ncbi:MAG: VOC family protein [Proteobacteria bacterium]|nr:VOC family protein [Pseudomonadota bacterium]MBU6425912.1 VOC family protein [Rhodospirillales bacterium]
MLVNPYLNFSGRCQEALDFYQEALGARVLFLMRYKDSPEPMDPAQLPPGAEKMVMHVSFAIGETTLMGSDGRPGQTTKFEGFSLSLQPGGIPEAERLFAALSQGGEVRMPMGKTFFSPAFGVVADKFGVSWMVYVPQPMG